MEKGTIIDSLEITDISSEGKGVGRVEGQVVFIKETVPGDVVKVKIVGKRKRFLEGITEKIIEASPDRVEPFCEHFGLCGGCKWQHMNYDAQLRHKQAYVEENLRKLSGLKLPIAAPILESKKTTFYRNKLEYTFSNFRWLTREEIDSDTRLIHSGLGFHITGRFDKMLNINKCWLQRDPSNEIRLAVKGFADKHCIPYFDLRKQEGFLRNLIIRTASTGDVMVILQVAYRNQEWLALILNFIKEKFSSITSLHYVVNGKGNDSFHDLDVRLFSGKDHIMEEMGDLKFRIGPKSFYQTNAEQAYELYKIVAEYAGLTGEELVYDLYTGAGTIANFIAGNAKKIIGIEYAAAAIEDAKLNSKINGITNTDFFAGDMKKILVDDFISRHGKPDVIITDPPRAGMHPEVTRLLADLKVSRIVYLGCNPATQARDLKVLGRSYEVIKIQPIDMFPQTRHVECVVLLQLCNSK